MRILIAVALLAGCACGPASEAGGIPEYGYEVVHTYPHDPGAFTQGLFYLNGFLYEGTGLPGESSIRKVRLETGEVLQKRDIPDPYFGEGIIAWKDRLIELTWQAQAGFIYDLGSFAPRGDFHYPGEGWGLTLDGKRIVMSDGTPELRFWDPDTLKELGRLTVTDEGRPVKDLNELEWVKGEIYANIWQSDRIARIDPLHRQSDRMDQPRGAGYPRRTVRRRPGRRAQRNRLRRQGRPLVRHRKKVAQAVRDPPGKEDGRAVACPTAP
jgi:glutaminyl-peptide cyclotransferase